MKKSILCIILLIPVIVTIVIFIIDPLRMPKYFIKKQLLSEIPYGTTKNEVVKVINSHSDWEMWNEGQYPPESAHYMKGSSFIQIYIGEYRFIFKVYVRVHFDFDINDNLVDLIISKETDSL